MNSITLNSEHAIVGLSLFLIGVGIGGWGFALQGDCNILNKLVHHEECSYATGLAGVGVAFLIVGGGLGVVGVKEKEAAP